MGMIQVESPKVIDDLRSLMATDCSRRVAEVARQRAEGLDLALSFLSDRSHRVAFVGQIGIGKSSMIGVLTELIAGDPPTDRASLKSNSVLAVGSGGTTVCEVRIRATTASETGKIGLFIDPYSVEEMRREIRLFAVDEWTRRKIGKNPASDDGHDPTPREVQRVIRHMTGLSERSETVIENGEKKRRTIDPLDDIVAQHDSVGSLSNFLVDRASLLSRTETQWWWESGSDTLQNLKRRFDDINHGRLATAMLPKQITIAVPAVLPGLPGEYEVEVVDTRGFDGQLSGRADIQSLLRDPRTLVVVCLPFVDAPGESIKALLRDVLADGQLRGAASRMSLVLVDKGDAEGVNDANGDRDFGQQLKRAECSRSLYAAGIEVFAAETNTIAFDTLQDDRQTLLSLLANRIAMIRAAVAESLGQQVKDAESFLSNLEVERIELAREDVDQRLRTALEANYPSGSPLRDPLDGLYVGIREWRFASQIYASCLRYGRYPNMNAYSIIRSGAAKAATEWLKSLESAMEGTFKALEHDHEFKDVLDHIRLRRSQYVDGHIAVIGRYADSVLCDVVSVLENHGVWELCAEEWGTRVPGFKERIIEHLKDWSRSQGSLEAHRRADTTPLLPVSPASLE
ncbi:MAG: hypothetical protein JSS49_28120 [Planctomycetes bacterium]|nr:hypothetical protein [Planctomycetota bacterium]